VADMSTLTALTTVVGSHGEHDGYWFPFAFFWLVLLGFLVWCVVRGGRWRHHHPSDMDRARGNLAERFARGEITGEQYRERLEQLR
jgi:putative membrane protein